MGKSQKYTEDQLLDGVVKYSEIYKKKIKATELASWCRRNIVGLEEVRDYHFKRNVKERELKTGKATYRQKKCALRINEINKSRDLKVKLNSSLLFNTLNIDVIFEQPVSVQRNLIVEARTIFDKLFASNNRLLNENEKIKSINDNLSIYIEDAESKTSELRKSVNKIEKQVNYLMKAIDLENRKEMLRRMGIDDEKIDLDTYVESLNQSIDEIMNINNLIHENQLKSSINISFNDSAKNKTIKLEENLVEKVIRGIDFE